MHMVQGKFVSYCRVSTQQQSRSGLGLEAQQSAVASFLDGGSWRLIGEFIEIETGKGANALDRRPQLRAALETCKKHKATLVIAKLDRLARNVHFVTGLIESGVDFVAADMPQANKVMIQMHAVMSEWERDQISARTKEALAAAKERGVKLGKAGPQNLKRKNEEKRQAAREFAERLHPTITALKQRGYSQRRMADHLNELGIKAAWGGSWSQTQIGRLLAIINQRTE